MEQVKIVKCPTCGQEVLWRPESEFRPFCSKRCKLIDLGAWADEEYTVGAQEPQDWQESDLKR
ncbi:DNA gyrase inhibitor YacG [Vitreoscilla sp. C1]|uniref:DNA gyrase inhibitor YacG n=1 Tax=Vitreoscilla sp. (strain C1) TaxID=96942 RepID=UPI000CDC06CC|nr:DNA gyrase inhibitor YacG [Vitreoscilla sp. C1]AUZ05853.1 DNA gyrase inhibitor YacG [Vitreoscilla sp. C1]